MADPFNESYYSVKVPGAARKEKNNVLLHLTLFIFTFITTTLAGMEWTTGIMGPYEIKSLMRGLPYSISIMFILASHEFGHYFAAKLHKVKATLPYFIPLPSFYGLFLNFGTMGAVIKTKTPIPDNKSMFDIGVAGPIAGFIASIIVLLYGFSHLPGIDYLLAIHPDYFSPSYGKGGLSLVFGDTFLFSFLRNAITPLSGNGHQFIPPMSEVYHYPFLCVGWFGLFITAMNMIPVGQLDGGHIIYSMFGTKLHKVIATTAMIILMVLGILGTAESFLNFHTGIGWSGWLFWALILFFIIKVKHPPVGEFLPLDRKRMAVGYFSLFILIVSFSPAPIGIF